MTAATPPAIYSAIGRDQTVQECANQAHVSATDYARRNYAVGSVRLALGPTVYYATGGGPCAEGNANVQLLAYVVDPQSRVHLALSDYAIRWHFQTDGTAVVDGHDSAAVSVRAAYVFDGTKYRVTKRSWVYEGTGETKPYSVPIHFAGGASSATLAGKVRLGFGDYYTLDAAAKQTMSVTVRPLAGNVGTLSIGMSGGTPLYSGSARTWHGALPQAGTYQIVIDGADESPARYRLTVEIH